MQHYYWNDWYSGWGWFLWFGLIFVMFSSFGNWGYIYKAHRRIDGNTNKNALDILKERYARGEIKHDEFLKMKSHISGDGTSTYSSNRENREMNNNKHTNPTS